ncbi:aminopeptidase [bacterium]|nr:aminopeptidase [bacterium]
MFDAREYFRNENDAAMKSYEKSLVDIGKVLEKIKSRRKKDSKDKYYRLLAKIARIIIGYAKFEKKAGESYFAGTKPDMLAKTSRKNYEELLPENYSRSYANPQYAVKVFGDGLGQLLSYFYIRYRQYITYSAQHKIFEMERYNRVFLEVYAYIAKNKPDYETLRRMITAPAREETVEDMARELKEQMGKRFRFYADIVECANLDDPCYLYRYGSYISDEDVRISRFFSSYPEEKIMTLSRLMVQAYLDGFKLAGKDVSKKRTVKIVFNAGQERLVRQLIKDLRGQGLDSILEPPSSTPANRQYAYDHRFDRALYMDSEWVDAFIEKNKKAFSLCASDFSAFSGVIVIEKFGEPPFKPEVKPENLVLSAEQQKLRQRMQGQMLMLQEQHSPRAETSFSIIAFPAPQIGEDFERIFEDVLEINMLESSRYQRMQQKIIEALDRAEYVHVKGKGTNRTDIKVKMQRLADPAKQTNFANCGADINIPVGEVFTSPQLEGTSGVLHVEEAFLSGLRYADLEMTFKDGYVTGYTCRNFESEEENMKFMKENLFDPHDTLPVGEFAIGTNTLAYVVARKYKITHLLPVLIIEKMGPHFAIGDTCFSHEEDRAVFNPDGREIAARENERSALRKQDFQKAYTNKHTDITLPYDSLDFITAVSADGTKVDVIRSGRFVIPGTEELNKPLDRYKE